MTGDTVLRENENIVWLPFASGNVVEIELTRYGGATGGRPVSIYHVHDVGPAMAKTADYAAEVAYKLAHSQGAVNGMGYSIGYSLKGLANEARIGGESGGLAMAIALYAKLTGSNVGKIAATGKLTSLQNGGSISGITGIAEKLTGTLDVLTDGGIFFYPMENDGEISEQLRQSCHEKNITLKGVYSVSQAIQLLGVVDDGQKEKGVSDDTVDNTGETTSVEGLNPAWILVVGLLILGGIGFATYKYIPWAEEVKPSVVQEPIKQSGGATQLSNVEPPPVDNATANDPDEDTPAVNPTVKSSEPLQDEDNDSKSSGQDSSSETTDTLESSEQPATHVKILTDKSKSEVAHGEGDQKAEDTIQEPVADKEVQEEIKAKPDNSSGYVFE